MSDRARSRRRARQPRPGGDPLDAIGPPGGPEAGLRERAAARAALKQLAVRLRKALFVQKGESSLWVGALTPLLENAAAGFWSPERRLLHDLQNVCLDHEREVFRLEPIGWLFSLGRRPLKHPLPHLREVNMSKHLRSAARRLRRVRLARDQRARLDGLLHSAVRRAEDDLRERFRHAVDATLESSWVRPANLPERVAYRKLVEELLDPIVSRGFTTLGDLRDAASRGNLKLSDLASPAEFLQGDRLLQSDRALAQALDGVHRRGEVYLRWLQRFSALAFGTPVGRFLTLYLALPFGGTFVLLKGLEEIDELTIARFTAHPCSPGPCSEHPAAGHGGPRGDQLRAVPPRLPRAAGRGRPDHSRGRSWTCPRGCSIIRCCGD